MYVDLLKTDKAAEGLREFIDLLLEQEEGTAILWHCSGGKDRTSVMDVECKFLSTLLARNQQIPEPGAPLTDEQKKLFRTIAFEGGNFEMQRLNTGVGGYKTDGVDSIPERLGGSEFREFHKGGAPLVGV